MVPQKFINAALTLDHDSELYRLITLEYVKYKSIDDVVNPHEIVWTRNKKESGLDSFMSCKHPLDAWYTGAKTENGADEIVILQNDCVLGNIHNQEDYYLPVHIAEKRVKHRIEYASGYMKTINGHRWLSQHLYIPCGRCIGCLLERSRQWAVRCVLESKMHPEQSNHFFTLTYDDEHLPEDGKLKKRDIQLFIKRLRKAFPESRIRYLLAGEYGDTTHRPHYHAIVFGLPIPDLELYKSCSPGAGDCLYTSKTIESIWSNGYVVIGDCTFETCAYVSRYVTKKFNDRDCFQLVSRRPGIGKPYFDTLDLSAETSFKLYEDFGLRKVNSYPKYFQRLIKQDPSLDSNLKAYQELSKATAIIENVSDMVSLGYDHERDYLEFKGNRLEDKAKRLKRNQV